MLHSPASPARPRAPVAHAVHARRPQPHRAVLPPQGFVEVLEDFDGLLLDVPDACHVMTLFICRAITDDILPPSFVSRLTPPPGSPLEELKKKCAAHLSHPHSAERLLRCWGAGTAPPRPILRLLPLRHTYH